MAHSRVRCPRAAAPHGHQFAKSRAAGLPSIGASSAFLVKPHLTQPAQRPCVRALALTLNQLSNGDTDYWAFLDRDERDFVHPFFQYPAMMVPQMQRQLIETFLGWDPTIRTIYDPFTGSGTVMTESMLKGLNFFGTDINPLAILLSYAKSGSFDCEALEDELTRVLSRIGSGRIEPKLVEFPNHRKWFEPHVSRGLGLLRASIMASPNLDARRLFWIALAETVRLSSNSRTSTVKLHIRPRQEINRRPDPLPLFEEIAIRNLRVLEQQRRFLLSEGLLTRNRYRGRIDLRLADVRHSVWDQQADIMVTSPPYGDNHTTVTYGQASYLPLQWIDRHDIDKYGIDDCIANTHRLDTLSLGGSRSHTTIRSRMEDLCERSPHLRSLRSRLKNYPPDRIARVIAFYADLDVALDQILDHVRPGGLLVWITGDRTVGGHQVPMSHILSQLLGTRVHSISALSRRIPTARKRMPLRNRSAPTMRAETILVMQKTF